MGPDTAETENIAENGKNTLGVGDESSSSPDNEVAVDPASNNTVVVTQQPTNQGANAPVEATEATDVSNNDTVTSTEDNTDTNESNDTDVGSPSDISNSTNTETEAEPETPVTVETTAPPVKVTTAPAATSTMASAKYIGFSLITLLAILF